jgi:tight adherence protein B
MLTLIALVVFVLVALLVFAVGSFVDQRSAQARMLRDRLASVQKAEQQTGEDLALLRDEMMSKIPALDTLLRRSERMANFQIFLEQADLKVRAGNILLLCVVSAVVVGTIGYLVAGSLPPNQAVLFVMVGVVLGATLPYSYASYRRTKRFQRFEELFPNAIDTLARAVRDALMNLAGRVPLVDVKFFVTAVMLQRETGGNLAEILDNLSYVIRERFKIMRQVRVYTAQGRLTMMLLMGLPPIIVVVMLTTNPAFIQPLFADPIGHTLVVGGIVLQTIGYFVIRKIIQIQV